MGRSKNGPPAGGPEHVGDGDELDAETIAEMGGYGEKQARRANRAAALGRIVGEVAESFKYAGGVDGYVIPDLGDED